MDMSIGSKIIQSHKFANDSGRKNVKPLMSNIKRLYGDDL